MNILLDIGTIWIIFLTLLALNEARKLHQERSLNEFDGFTCEEYED